MELYYVNGAVELRNRAKEIEDQYYREKVKNENVVPVIPEDFCKDFFALVDKVNLSLMEDEDNFYGYFLLQMSREIRFDISTPTAVNFKGAKYILYFNPLLFLTLNRNQMETTIKHEILHIVSMHLIRARDILGSHRKAAVNMAMDILVNQYLNNLPPYATTLEWVNYRYNLKLKPYAPLEYYAVELQKAIEALGEEAPEDHGEREAIETEFSVSKTHDLWLDSDEVEDKTLQEFTEKVITTSQKGEIPSYLSGMIAELKNNRGELPWNLYLNRLMGTMESNKKKTVTRRNRRQPERLDLRGELRSHKARIVVALDISGSISDDEFKQAMKEVISIVRNYKHEITVIECDDDIRQVYQVRSEEDIKERGHNRGATSYSPVFEYANHNKVNLLVYFTDGQGEERLKVRPRGYQVLWVISGRGDRLSLHEPYGTVKKLKQIKVIEQVSTQISEVVCSGISVQQQID